MSDTEKLARAGRNADLGYIYYQQQVESQGFPNGMPHWEELKPGDQYHHTVTGISFAQALEQAGFAKFEPGLIGFEDRARFGEGECQLLMDELERRWPSGHEEFQKRLKTVNALFGERKT